VADLRAAYDEGRTRFASFVKTPSQTTASGIWFDLSMSPGNPVPQYYFATPLAAQPMARSTDGGLDHGQPVAPAGMRKYLHKLMLQSVTATAAPLAMRLLDYLMYYPGVAMDTGVQDMTNAAALPRSVGGAGVQIMAVEQSSYIGSATMQVRYTNSAGVAGRLSPVVTLNTQIAAGTVATSAPATAGAGGPFVPLAHGDSGVQQIDGIEFFTGDVGLLALVLVRPLAAVCVAEITSPVEVDLLQELGYLPQVEDDAYLNFIAKPVGTLASAPIRGDITTLWSAA
jgi:hypothetical protein